MTGTLRVNKENTVKKNIPETGKGDPAKEETDDGDNTANISDIGQGSCMDGGNLK